MSSVMRITGVLAGVVMAAAPASAQVTSGREPDASPWPTVRRDTTFESAADTSFIRQAIRGHYTEVGLGRVAESRADNDAVEDFAERMVSDHNDLNEEWSEVAREHDMSVAPDFGEEGRQAIDRLEDLEGAEFDQAYMNEMIRRHEQDLAAFQRMAASARSSEVRRLADNGATSIREHLALARQVGGQVGVSSTAGRAGDVFVPTTDRATRDERDARDRDDRKDRGALRAKDRAFVQNVLQDHLMHLRLAERARREARSDETRRLAQRMEDDFERWQERWEDVADRYDVKAPRNLGPLHRQKVDRLERASKGDVDRTYAAIVADHLASVVPYFRKEGQAVESAAVRRLVDDELPMIREHLERARRLEGRANRD